MTENGNISPEDFIKLESRMGNFEKELSTVSQGVKEIVTALRGNELLPGGIIDKIHTQATDIKALQVELAILRESTKERINLINEESKNRTAAIKQQMDNHVRYVVGVSVGVSVTIGIAWALIQFMFK